MIAATALLAGSLVVDAPQPVFASCDPARAHDTEARHVGAIGSSASLTGVKASIEEYSPYYSGQNRAGTNASVMLVKWNPIQWVQVGWLKSKVHTGSTTREVFVEVYLSDANNRYYWWPAESVGDNTAYKILFEGDREYTFLMNGAQIMWTNGGPTQPTGYQLFGETHDKGDQMPGGTGAHLSLSAARYYIGAGHSAVVVRQNTHNEGGDFYGAWTDLAGNYEIWDKKCNS